jgi:hypothetical protein
LTIFTQGASSFAADGMRAACRRTVPERFHGWNSDLMVVVVEKEEEVVVVEATSFQPLGGSSQDPLDLLC